MAKKIDLSKSVHDLVKEYPELKDIMADLGFKDILNPVKLNTVGRVMTIPKGAVMKEIDIPDILAALEKNGFEVEGSAPVTVDPLGDSSASEEFLGRVKSQGADDLLNKNASGLTEEAKKQKEKEADRNKLLESYVRRLSEGEELETVRRDFVEKFSDVDALEIANAEQALIQGGMPVAEVQKLCDVHSALFHGATREERIANAEAAVDAQAAELVRKRAEAGQKQAGQTEAEQAQAGRIQAGRAQAEQARVGQKQAGQGQPAGRAAREEAKSRMRQLSVIMGHPVYTLTHENKLAAEEIKKIQAMLAQAQADGADPAGTKKENLVAEVETVRAVVRHYAKKGDLIYPVLKTKYNVYGPSDVMWGVDDEIRDELAALVREAGETENLDAKWQERLNAVLTRADEMIYKENNILLPICVQFFSDEEWYHIYHEIKAYRPTLIEGYKTWPEGEAFEQRQKEEKTSGISNQEVVLPEGHLTPRQIAAILNTIPGEITFIDDQDINRYFNDNGKEEKLFKRPQTALDRSVYTCHPPKYEPMTRQVIKDLKSGEKDSVDIWMVKEGQPVLVRYMAVRDDQGYVGTMEFVQRMQNAADHFKNNSVINPD